MKILSGSRGSSVLLAKGVALGSRYQLDPATGDMGFSTDSAIAMSQSLYRNLFNKGAPYGVRADEMGEFYDIAANRGWLNAGSDVTEQFGGGLVGSAMGGVMNKMATTSDGRRRLAAGRAARSLGGPSYSAVGSRSASTGAAFLQFSSSTSGVETTKMIPHSRSTMSYEITVALSITIE